MTWKEEIQGSGCPKHFLFLVLIVCLYLPLTGHNLKSDNKEVSIGSDSQVIEKTGDIGTIEQVIENY